MGPARGKHHGVLVLDKPAGPSSHEVVAWVRRALGERRVGHCGTLDPAATGVLVVCVGEATKLVQWLTDDDKRYAATIVLGRSTTTADAEGDTVDTAAVGPADLARAAEVVAGLHGALELSPPTVSAVRIDGVRAHARARAGEAFALPTRAMHVHASRLLGVDAAAAAIRVELDVGKGTYIRSIAEHLGHLVGLPAHLGALRRLRTGGFDLESAAAAGAIVAVPAGARPDGKPRHRLAAADDASPHALTTRLAAALRPLATAAPPSWPRTRVADGATFAKLCNGMDFDPAVLEGGGPLAAPAADPYFVLVAGPDGTTAVVIARVEPGPPARLRPHRVLDPGPPGGA